MTNTGSRTCHLYGYPALRFGEAQAVPPGRRRLDVVHRHPGGRFLNQEKQKTPDRRSGVSFWSG
ncbi:DUF4232 domain-containing protein [Streptomyces collinus]